MLYISGTFWDVFLYLCFSRVGISSGSLSEPPLSLGTFYMLRYNIAWTPTQRAWLNEMPLSLFFKWTQLFDLVVSRFRLLSTSQIRSISTYICLWKSHFNCQLAKQTVVAITGSETENAQTSNVNCFRKKYIQPTGSNTFFSRPHNSNCAAINCKRNLENIYTCDRTQIVKIIS